MNERPPYQRNVSTVFQSYALFPHLTVERNIAFGLEERGEKNVGAKIGPALEMVQLTGKEKRLPAQLSGGEKQRVALARSLVLEPSVLLLDEPLAALDLQLRKAMRTELKLMQRRTGITFLFVTHDQEEALSMSDEIAMMNRGRIEQLGSPQEVYLRPATRFVAEFLGAMNWSETRACARKHRKISRDGDLKKVLGARDGVAISGESARVVMRLDTGEEATAEIPRGMADYRARRRGRR